MKNKFWIPKRLLAVGMLACACSLVFAFTLTTQVEATDAVGHNVVITDSITNGDYVYVTGYQKNQDISYDDDPGEIGQPLPPVPLGSYDVFVAKYSKTTGARVAYYTEDILVNETSVTVPTLGNDYSRAITLDPDGNVYITGQAYSTTNSYSKLFVRKYNSSLAPQGSVYLYSNANGNKEDNGNDIQFTNLESDDAVPVLTPVIYVAGTVQDGSNLGDVIAIRLDLSLSQTWATALHTSGTSSVTATDTSDDKGIKLFAQKEDGGNSVFIAGTKDQKVMGMRFTSGGSVSWATEYDLDSNSATADTVKGLVVGPRGANKVYIATTTATATNGLDIGVIRFHKATGGYLSSRIISGDTSSVASSDECAGIVFDSSYLPYVVGTMDPVGLYSKVVIQKLNADLSLPSLSPAYITDSSADVKAFSAGSDGTHCYVAAGKTASGYTKAYVEARLFSTLAMDWSFTPTSTATYDQQNGLVAVASTDHVFFNYSHEPGATSTGYVDTYYLVP